MALHGLDMDMYRHSSPDIASAIAKFCSVADEMIAKNRARHPFILENIENPKYADQPSTIDPAFASKYYYIHDQGIADVCVHAQYCMHTGGQHLISLEKPAST